MTSPQRGLIRLLGVGFGLAVIVGSTLGVGILRTPGLVAGQLSNSTTILAVWIVGGLYTLVGAVCLAELGTMLPEAGGYYVYARRSFGEAVGFGVGWTDWLTYCSVLGYVSIAIGEFSALLVPSLAGYEKPIALLALGSLAALQLAGLRVSSRFQEVTTVLKCGAFLILIVAAIAFAPDLPASAVAMPTTSLSSLIVALQSVVIAYGGWQAALYFSEEDRDPGRNIPRSMIGGVVSVIVVYLLVNIALLRVMPLGDLARSTLPAADAAQILIGGRGRQIITILSIVSLPPMMNAILMIGTRILFAMGRDGLLWRRAAIRHDWRDTGGRHAHHDDGGAGTRGDRHVPATGGGGVLLPGRQLRGLLPGVDRLAPARAEPRTAVSRMGLPVVRGARARGRNGIPGRCDCRRYRQRVWRRRSGRTRLRDPRRTLAGCRSADSRVVAGFSRPSTSA